MQKLTFFITNRQSKLQINNYKAYDRWNWLDGNTDSYSKCNNALISYYDSFCGAYLKEKNAKSLSIRHKDRILTASDYAKLSHSKPYDTIIAIDYIDDDDLEAKWNSIISFVLTVNNGFKNRLYFPCGTAYCNNHKLRCVFKTVWLSKESDNIYCFSKSKAINQLKLSSAQIEGEDNEKTINRLLKNLLSKALEKGAS